MYNDFHYEKKERVLTKQSHFKIACKPYQEMDLQQKSPRTEHPKTNPFAYHFQPISTHPKPICAYQNRNVRAPSARSQQYRDDEHAIARSSKLVISSDQLQICTSCAYSRSLSSSTSTHKPQPCGTRISPTTASKGCLRIERVARNCGPFSAAGLS